MPKTRDGSNRPRLSIKGFIDDEVAQVVHDILTALEEKDSPDIDVFIRSEGGGIDASLHIYDDLTHYKGHTRGIVVGFAYSAAVTVLQGCEERLSYPHAKLLIHYGSLSGELPRSLLTPSAARQLRKTFDTSVRRVSKILALRSGRTLKQIHKLMDEDREIIAAEALKFGLIDKII